MTSQVKESTIENAENPGFDIDQLILMADWEDLKEVEEENYQGQLSSQLLMSQKTMGMQVTQKDDDTLRKLKQMMKK